jgi:uncharacterized repeat protein (TIGR02543 family)
MSAFGSGPSNGQFWFGGSTFPGFLYKKNLGVGARRSTKMAPGGNITCNSETYLYNKYKPGGGGVGASSMSNRRAKNRLATVCSGQKCFPCYNTLGQYSNYTHNPNGFIPCPAISSSISSIIPTPTPTPTPPSGTYTLTYDANGGTGTAPAPPTSYSGGASVTVLGQGGFTRTNRLFGGWNTASFGGTGTYYDTTDILTMPYADTILYAQWYNPAGTDYQVIYNGNGSTGGIVPATAPYKSGQGVGISGNTGSLTKTGFTFYGWNTAANGLGTAYPITSNGFTMPAADVTLYAQWVDTSATPYTLTYFGNGNTSGTVPSATSYPSGTSTSVVSLAPIAKSGYTFLGWNTAANGSGINYSNNASIVMDSNKSLFAQWAGGVLVKNCPEGFNIQLISMGSASGYLYRDNTNNTMTIITQVKYSTGPPYTPFGTGNGPIDTTHTGNILNTYSRVDLSQVAGVYTFNILYVTNWRDSTTGAIQTETQTGTLSLGSTYWPTGQTIQDITITTTGFASFPFSCLPSPVAPPAPTPLPQTSFTVSSFGCNSDSQGIPSYVTISQILVFYINFNNGTTTRVAIAGQNQWQGTANPFILNYNRTRIELANGLSPATSGGPFPSSGTLTTTSVNSSV